MTTIFSPHIEMIPENKYVRQVVCHFQYVNTAVEDSELDCYNTEGDKNSSRRPHPFLPSSSPLADVLFDPTDLIWRKGAPLEAMTGRTAPSSDGVLAEVFWGFPQL